MAATAHASFDPESLAELHVDHPRRRPGARARGGPVAIAAGRPFALEYRVARAEGGWRWILDRGVRTVDRHGHEWLDGIIFDITERRAAEQALRAAPTSGTGPDCADSRTGWAPCTARWSS